MKIRIVLSIVLATVALAAVAAQAKSKPSRAVSVAISPERRVLAADRPETALVKIGLTGAALPHGERPAVNLALVLDRSGSMHGDRIARAREAAIAAVERSRVAIRRETTPTPWQRQAFQLLEAYPWPSMKRTQ